MDPNKLSCRSVWCPTLAQFRRDGYRLGTVDRAGLWSGIVRDIFDPPVGHCRRPRTGEKSAERLGHFHGIPFRGFAELRHGRGGSVPWKPAARKKSVLVPVPEAGGLATRRRPRKARIAAIAGPARVRGSCALNDGSPLRSVDAYGYRASI